MYTGKLFDSFSYLQDNRQEGKVQHKLIDIIFIVISAVICGCNDWKEIHMWASAETTIVWLKKYIELRNGVPSLSTIGRVFNTLDTKHFQKCFSSWMTSVIDLEDNDLVPIDGKTSRGSQEKTNDKKAIHVVSALCNSKHLVLGQVKTDEKSNEITAIPELLDMLYIKNCIVTIDAMGAQKKIAEKIVNENKADYVLALKGNQETLEKEVKEYYEDLEKSKVINKTLVKNHLDLHEIKTVNGNLGIFKTIEKGHGRIEKRTYYYSTDIDWMVNAKLDWTKLTGIGMIKREIEYIGTDKITVESSFYFGSIKEVKDFARAVRNHWRIESMHWNLDVTFRDDENRSRKGNIAANLALLKRIAFNSVKNDTKKHPKQSMKGKRFIALMDAKYRDYLLDLNFKER
jgi:predicted transposase YbfD/YdcC